MYPWHECVLHICQKRGLHLDPQRFLDKSPIPVVVETKCLGVIYESRISFVPHLKYLNMTNILNVVGNTEWVADERSHFAFLVRSKLKYGCMVYGPPCI